MQKARRLDIDILKGISIIAVVLYHVGLLPYGYLGVDTFLVISGFLTIPSIIKNIAANRFSYFKWLQKRIFRFLPLVLLASFFCLIVGYWTMIPNDYENLSEAIVASSVFCENILSAITTKDYWNTANEFKPLMHLWYLGIIVQFYALFPLVLLFVKKICKRSSNMEQILSTTVFIITLISFICFILPQFNFNEKFYYLPFRIWEFGIGGLIGSSFATKNLSLSKTAWFSVLIVLIGCFCCYFKSLSQIDNITIVGFSTIDIQSISKDILLITTVTMSALLLLNNFEIRGGFCESLGFIGKMSFSIFVWHQIFLAFLRYTLVDQITLPIFIAYIVVVLIISYLSYKYIESLKIETRYAKVTCIGIWMFVIAVSLLIYRNAGVVRDVPELGITTKAPFANRNTEYIDRLYGYQNPFSTNKTKVLVVGNSFARDFACCLLEWDTENTLELSYMYGFNEETDTRFGECDFLFCFGKREDVPQYVWQAIKPDCEVYGIGTKSYGKSFGRIYARRFNDDYYNSAIPVHPKLEQANESYKKSWGEQHYIDFIKASLREDGLMRLFTPDNKIISFDCEHLTPYGCRYLASQFDFDKIFK